MQNQHSAAGAPPASPQTTTAPNHLQEPPPQQQQKKQQPQERDDVAIPISCVGSRSVFELYPRRTRARILATVSLSSLLVPLCDTVYLPALQSIQEEFATTQALVAASVAVYMGAVGVAALLWGPASDRYGRRAVYLVSALLFLATSLVCVFAPSIAVLVAFRALQGAAISAFGSTGSAVIADVYAPAERGAALGISTVPMLLGPILGPILGGGLSQAFSWRATFIAVAAYTGVVVLPLLVLMPETHHYRRVRSIHKKGGKEAALEVAEAPDILATPPVFRAPWFPLAILCERDVLLHAATTLMVFGSMFCSITELPVQLALPPYNLPPSLIGLAYVPAGVASMIFSPLGGKLSDWAAAARPATPLVRLLPNTAAVGAALPAALLLYGWAAQARLHLVVVLAAQFLVGAANACFLPAIFGYLTVTKQAGAAAAAAAGVHSLMFVASAVLIVVASGAVGAMGFGAFFTLLAVLDLLVAAAAVAQILRRCRRDGERGRRAAGGEAAGGEAMSAPGVKPGGGGSGGGGVAIAVGAHTR